LISFYFSYFRCGALALHSIVAEFQILDFSRAQLVSIDTGLAKIQNGNLKLIHSVDLNQYETFANNLEIVFKKDVIKNHPEFQYLRYELTQIEESVIDLKPKKQKRSIDILGTAIKYIAGNPDHEDYKIMKNKINNVINTHNNQVTINRKQNERIEQITDITNQILNFIHSNNKFNDQLASQIRYQLKLVKEDLSNIKQSIHWATKEVVNSQILSKQEIMEILETLEKDRIPYKTVEEALNFAKVTVFSNPSYVIFVINIPLTNTDTYSKLLLKPIKNKNIVNEILYENILLNENDIFGIKKSCKTINNITICNQNQVISLNNSTCISKLLKSLKSTCNIINNQHLATVEEISPGIILLNQFDGMVEIDNVSHLLNGTFLIKFYNTTIKINGEAFVAMEKSYLQILPAILQPMAHGKEVRELLSLELMKEVQINNTKIISLLQDKHDSHQTITYGLITTTLILMIAMVANNIRRLVCRQRSANTDKNHIQIELKPISSEEAPATVSTEDRQPRKKFYEV
jgi:Gypsy protein/Baculovirus F protein